MGAMATNPPAAEVSASIFPGQLARTPENTRVTEQFGWSAINWSFGLVLFSSLALTQPAKPVRGEYIAAAATFSIGILLLIFGLRRRKNPRTLVRFPEHNTIGIYKRGLLQRTVKVEGVNLVLYHPGRTWGPLLALASVAVGFAIFVLPGAVGISRTNHVYAGLASLLFLSFTASVIKTRLLCEVCMFPYEKKRGSEWIMVRRKTIRQLLSRTPSPGN